METRHVWKAGPDLTATQQYVDKAAALNMDRAKSLVDASVCMAGRASIVTSASPTLAVYMAPVESPGSAYVIPTGAAIFAIKI